VCGVNRSWRQFQWNKTDTAEVLTAHAAQCVCVWYWDSTWQSTVCVALHNRQTHSVHTTDNCGCILVLVVGVFFFIWTVGCCCSDSSRLTSDCCCCCLQAHSNHAINKQLYTSIMNPLLAMMTSAAQQQYHLLFILVLHGKSVQCVNGVWKTYHC